MAIKKSKQERDFEEKALRDEDLFARIDFGIRKGVARALIEHKKAGVGIVVMEKGKIKKIPPEKIKIPKEFKYLLRK